MVPAVSGLLLAGAFPPFGLVPLAFVALAPFIRWVADLPRGGAGAGTALRGGIVLGAVHFGVLLHWIAPALLPLTRLAPFVYLAAVGVLALLVGLLARAAHALRDRWGISAYVGLPLAWAAGEWLRGAAGDLAFPWMGLAVALAPVPSLAGAAELVGAGGVGLWIAAINGAVAAVVGWLAAGTGGFRWGAVPWARASVVTFALLLPAAWGLARDATLETRDAGVVVAVRTELPREAVADPEVRERLGTRALEHGAELLEGGGLQGAVYGRPALVVWPETLLLERVAGEPDRERHLADLARRAGVPFLVGGYVPVEGTEGIDGNGLALYEPDDGEDGASWTYAKRRLVPGVEAAPFLRAGERLGGLARGRGAAVGRVGTLAFGPLVCYESAFPGRTRAARAEGAEVLVNATNDAWFGGRGWLGGRAGLKQHPPHLVLRALEARAGVVRSAQVGPAFFVDPRGRVLEGEPVGDGVAAPGVPELRVATVGTTEGRTLHTRTGDWVGWGSAALVILLLVVPPRRIPGRSGGRSLG